MKASSITFIISILVIVGAVVVGVLVEKKPSIYEGFAQCVNDSESVFYGSATCPHCIQQKADFGKAAALLPYVECNPQFATEGELAQCEEAGVTGTPYWTFPENKEGLGRISLEEIAAGTGCQLPEEHKSDVNDEIATPDESEAAETTPLINEEA